MALCQSEPWGWHCSFTGPEWTWTCQSCIPWVFCLRPASMDLILLNVYVLGDGVCRLAMEKGIRKTVWRHLELAEFSLTRKVRCRECNFCTFFSCPFTKSYFSVIFSLSWSIIFIIEGWFIPKWMKNMTLHSQAVSVIQGCESVASHNGFER